MALKKTITLIDNFEIEVSIVDAYIRVGRIEGDKDKILAFVDIMKEQGGRSFKTELYTLDHNLDGGNPIKQAYKYLKTLPEFEGATDC